MLAIGDAVRRVPAMTQRDALVEELTHPHHPTLLTFVNAHACNLAVSDPQLERDLVGADVVLRDGSGMALLYRAQGLDAGLNMNGTDFIPVLIRAFEDQPIALIGTREPWLAAAAERIAETSRVVLVRDGFLDEDQYLRDVRDARPALVILGMGMPRQERVGTRLRAELEHPCLIVCGGAILDFLGGKVQRAPAWLRRLGLEWIWRLVSEPRRLFRRYVVGNAVFVVRLGGVWGARRLRSVSRRRASGGPR